MKNRLLEYCVFLALVLTAPSAYPQSLAASAGVQRSVQVVTTLYGKGMATGTVSSADIEVRVEGKTAHVFDLAPLKGEPLQFTVALDLSNSEKNTAKQLKDMCVQLFTDLAKGSNRGSLVVIQDTVTVVPGPLSSEQVKAKLAGIPPFGGTALYDGIVQVVRGPLSRAVRAQDGRRVLILISDGEDNMSTFGPAPDVVKAAAREGVVVVPVMTWSDYYSGPTRGEKFLNALSRTTGGVTILPKRKEDNLVPIIETALEQQFLLKLAPEETPAKGEVHLTVKSKNGQVKISAPSSIWVD